MAQLARKPCSDIITSQTSRLAPPSSQKSRNRVVNARGAATGAGAESELRALRDEVRALHARLDNRS